MLIRPETSTDLPTITRIHREAFRRDSEALLVDRLRHEHVAGVSLVAQVDDAVVGHVRFSQAQLVLGARSVDIGSLGPIGVLRSQRRRGIAAALIREGLDRCWRLGWPAVIVLGDPAYYGRFGFERADAWSIRCDLDVPAEAFMILFAATPIQGPAVAKYHPAFATA